jgi:hypothetical protein
MKFANYTHHGVPCDPSSILESKWNALVEAENWINAQEVIRV